MVMNQLQFKKITQPYIIEAFYLADRQDEHIVDDVINIATGLFPCNWNMPPVSHEERGVYVDGRLMFFSSTSRKELGSSSKKKNGTRWIDAHELLRNPDRWLLLKSPVQHEFDIKLEIFRANEIIDMEYDFVGVVLDFMRPGIFWNKRKKIYCSKACHKMETDKFKRRSPKRRYNREVLLDYTPTNLLEIYEMEGCDE